MAGCMDSVFTFVVIDDELNDLKRKNIVYVQLIDMDIDMITVFLHKLSFVGLSR
jgi:hypothetical protein